MTRAEGASHCYWAYSSVAEQLNMLRDCGSYLLELALFAALLPKSIQLEWN